MYLIDTHVLLWALDDIDQLSQTASEILRKNKNTYVSIVSFWEITIKKSIGKLDFKYSMKELSEICASMKLKILPITPSHLDRISKLSQIHNDPFDRLLIAQAQEENFTFITKDSIIPKYDIKTVW